MLLASYFKQKKKIYNRIKFRPDYLVSGIETQSVQVHMQRYLCLDPFNIFFGTLVAVASILLWAILGGVLMNLYHMPTVLGR